MSDDKTKTGAADRARVAGKEQYEVDYFANKHGITNDQAEEIVKRAGNDRRRADELAETVE